MVNLIWVVSCCFSVAKNDSATLLSQQLATRPNPVVGNALAQPVELAAQAVVVLAVQPVRRLEGFAVQAVGLLELLTMLTAGLVEFVADLVAAVLLMSDDPERGDHQRDKLHYGFRVHTRHASRPRRRRATRNNKTYSNFTANTSRVNAPASPCADAYAPAGTFTNITAGSEHTWRNPCRCHHHLLGTVLPPSTTATRSIDTLFTVDTILSTSSGSMLSTKIRWPSSPAR